MANVFKLISRKKLSAKEFCESLPKLTYMGRFVNKSTSEILSGEIIEFNNSYFSTEIFGYSGISFSPETADGFITTTVSLFKTEYAPDNYMPLEEYPIQINLWDISLNENNPIKSLAFTETEFCKAKKIVETYHDVDIFVKGVKLSKANFYASASP